MPIFVTGGTGFLGINLVRLLVDRGQRVRLLVRPHSTRLGLDSDLIEFVPGDVTDAESVLAAMRGCDEGYHLAAWVQISPWGLKSARRVNVEGTRNVCSVALKLGIRRMVHTSSVATIATGTLQHAADERGAWNLEHCRIPYYQTKKEAERVVLEHVKQGLDAVIVNPTYLVGPWDVKPGAGRLLIQAARRRLRFYPPRGGINYVDVRQAAAGHLLAIERGRTGERYILGGENLSFRAFLNRVTAAARVAAPRFALPYAITFPFAAAGSVAGRVFPRLFRDVNLSVLRSAFLEHYVTSEKACSELGYDLMPIDRAIEDAIAWFVEHGYMKLNPDSESSHRSESRRRAADRGPGQHIETARTLARTNRE